MNKYFPWENLPNDPQFPHPTANVYRHVIFKTGELGTILGGSIGTGISLYKGLPLASGFITGSSYGLVVGICLGIPLVYNRLKDQSDDAILDRAYRLSQNKGQVRMDTLVATGFTLFTLSALSKPSLLHLLHRGSMGVTAGIVSNLFFMAASGGSDDSGGSNQPPRSKIQDIKNSVEKM